MSPLAHDIKHKAAEAARLPSVEAWIAAGGRVERIESPPRLEAVMAKHPDQREPQA